MGRKISTWILKWWGWKIDVQESPLPDKCVYCVVPHTSNWDFPVGILVRNALGLDIKYVGKKSLFKPPLGILFKWLGGYPVDRSKRTHFVDAVADVFKESEKFAIAIAPEGTRKRVDKLKTGYYYIAKGAGVPIILTQLDWGRKTVAFRKTFYPTENEAADFQFIDQYFAPATGKNPKKGYRFQAIK